MNKSNLQQLKELSWSNLNSEELQELMILSWYAAVEFAESLRIALKVYPNDANLKLMAKGELSTNNIQFKTYAKTGDHSDFLKHFIESYKLKNTVRKEILVQGEIYLKNVRKLSNSLRAMSIFSREHELAGIFSKILLAKNWNKPGLSEYKYYLEKHIEIDLKEGGHSDLVSAHSITKDVNEFYKLRLELYKVVPKLFI